MVQVTVHQGHPRDHLPKTAGNDVLTISKNGMKVTEILIPSKHYGDDTPGLLKDRVSSSKDTIIYFFTKQTATKKEDTTTTPSYMSGVAQEGIRTSRLEPTYSGNVFPSEVLPSMNPPCRVEKGFLPRFTPVTEDNNARDQEGMTKDCHGDVPCIPRRTCCFSSPPGLPLCSYVY